MSIPFPICQIPILFPPEDENIESGNVIFINTLREPLKKNVFLKEYFLNKGGVGIPKLYVKFWWPLLLALKFTLLFLNLAKIQIFIPKSAYMNAGLLRASALRCGEHRQRRLPGKKDLLIRIPPTWFLQRCDFPRAPFPTLRTFVQHVCPLGWLKTSTPK